MTNLIKKQKLLFNDSEKSLFNLFNKQSSKKKVRIISKEFKNELFIQKRISDYQVENSLSKKLKNLEFNNDFGNLFEVIKKIEKNVSKEYAIKYLEGHLEYNKISLTKLLQENEIYDYVV